MKITEMTLCLFTATILTTILSCKRNIQRKLLLVENSKCWDVVYNQGHFEKNILVGYCFYNDSFYYAYNYYSGVPSPFNEGDFDSQQKDTTIAGNLRTWRLHGDTLYLRWVPYLIDRLTDDTVVLLTMVNSNPKIILAARK